ncbi:glycosyltransferase [Aeromonas bestiarum]|uniref:Glycosyltransferase n=1 Tax=Aeromonas bestiarum TaxID=105751 RepID=A0ABT7PW25_9GAMM|nr:glycosyltransferase [Aeromonas bestiarum]MDM5071292.1 glycosyltransferase [Aeromonas bestiarum]MDM5089043.1 glycosyltransferase [Aeromonas bestiarum]
MSFSVLMSLYFKENPCFLDQCLDSLFNQTVQANEIILVYDGPITNELNLVVAKWSNKLPIITLPLEKNIGLGQALNKGLDICSNDIVFRMDTDDICTPNRFEIQISHFKESPDIKLLGAYVAEFDERIEQCHAIKTVPCLYDEIRSYAKYRNPMNHMSVAFRRSAVMAAGGYQDDYLYEDYALWVRMITKGFIVLNIPEVLVYARTGNGMEVRRGGVKYALSEISVQKRFYDIGFISCFEFIRNLVIRLPIRLLPGEFRKKIYRVFLRK